MPLLPPNVKSMPWVPFDATIDGSRSTVLVTLHAGYRYIVTFDDATPVMMVVDSINVDRQLSPRWVTPARLALLSAGADFLFNTMRS